ncbi:methylmalonyl Co-A mutase-associated GTPase MeaB [Edaphobacter sp.]|uniref:methylmalonyl Co-A mutase-associated GTPase MeaB n=1 Tax=Edaphobacter sp. TaxID=1934404 RepID=UPI002DB56C1A|nr:methylmalonyl Co-A mutase-associated GTPase MeaB [Edaphobacter sp.]HEU5342396.1 methylmalonyl Co-A mutase-associated GTPase MeaB [Edaphobacter sp.]
MGDEIQAMIERLRAGDVRTLARAVSIVEDGLPRAAELLAGCRASRKALRVGVTGPPGAGKSTLVDQMVRLLRSEGKTVGVIAVDPSSPFTGGALLGDRIRMQGFAGDDGVFIRSMASRGAIGGVARAAANVCSVMEAAGRDVILIETVGAGQDEVEIVGLADVTVVVLAPGMGDEVQSLKAGLMEAADVFAVNKSDSGGAEAVESGIVAMQGLAAERGGWVPPVVRTVATTGEGVAELMAAVLRCAEQRGNRRSFDFGGKSAAFAQDDNSLSEGGVSELMAAVRLGVEQKPERKRTPYGVKLDHLGVAVRNIEAARGFYEALGLTVVHEETVEHEKVRTAMLPLGETRIELLEATEAGSVIGRFIERRGEGLHHIAVGVPDVDAMFTRLKAKGIRLASDAVLVGVGGHRYFFVHPMSTGGVLLEIVGEGEAG